MSFYGRALPWRYSPRGNLGRVALLVQGEVGGGFEVAIMEEDNKEEGLSNSVLQYSPRDRKHVMRADESNSNRLWVSHGNRKKGSRNDENSKSRL